MDIKVGNERHNTHSCDICKTAFPDGPAYMQHVLEHIHKAYVKVIRHKIHECKLCPAAFLKEDNLILHQLIHINKNVRLKHIKTSEHEKHYKNGEIIRKHICPKCGRRFTHESTLKAHSAVHEPYTYVCFCGIGYYSKVDFKGHQTVVHNNIIKSDTQESRDILKHSDKIINGDKCGFENKNNHEYGKMETKYRTKKKTKLKININKKPTKIESMPREKLDCAVCGKTLQSCNLQRHMNAFHLNKKIYKCSICNRSFRLKNNYDMHMAAYKKYKCLYCGKQFKNMSTRLLHERVHTGEKPYICNFCSKPFADPSALGRHERTHTKEYKYFCNVCPKKFTDLSGLALHKLRHGDKKVICDICDKKFYCKWDLMTHIQIHLQKKKFECHDCGKKFVLKSYLTIHMKSHCKKIKHKVVKSKTMS